MNNVILIGRLTKKPELRYTPSNVAVSSFTIAVNRDFKDANGETKADFINCRAWRKTAETMANHLDKGSLIAINGRIETGSYENQQGQRVFTTDVIVNNFQFLEPKREQQPQSNYNPIQPQKSPFEEYGASIEIDDESLPF